MAAYDVELIQAARRLVRRRAGQRGKLPAARVRRSVSTAYYALFHFVLEEAARSLIGSHNDLRRRRRTFARLFSHIGIKATFEKIRGTNVDPSVEDLLRPRGVISGPVPAPAFARDLALLKEFGVVGSIRPGLRRDDEGKSADRLSDPDSSKLEGRKPF